MEKTDLNYLRNFIAEGNIRQALDELLGILNSDARGRKQLRDDAILLRTQLNDTDRKENLNLITAAEASHDRAHLQKAILDLINELEESLRSPAVVIPASTPSAGGGTGKVLVRVIPIVLAALLVVLGVVFRKQLFGPGSQPESPAQENKAPVTAIPDQPSGAAEDNQTTQPSNIGDRPAEVTQQTGETAHSTGSTGQQGGGSKGGAAVAGQADLSVSDWRFTPDPPVQNQATRIDFTVENKGSKAAENFSVQWWAGVNFPQAEKTWTSVTLAAGEKKKFSYLYSGYQSWYGSLQTKIVVDPNQQITDKDRSNNVLVRTISVSKSQPATTGKADLSVSGWRFTPGTPVQNQAVRIDFTVENNGNKDAENFSIEWWAGVNYPGAEKTWTNVTVAAGERKNFSFLFAGYPSWYGSIQTKIVVDPNQRIDDKDRNNNVQVRTISVSKNTPAAAGPADLSVSDWHFTPETPVQNQATRIDFIVKNTGGKAAENFSIQWWAGVNAPQPVKTWTNVTLGPGEQKKFTYTYAGYPSWYGQLQTKVVVDPGRQVNDANRSNNEKILTIRVLKPG